MGDTAGVTDADDPLDDWAPLLDDLARRKGSAREMGGTDKVAKRRATGRLDARARIDHLLDEGSFTEIGTLVCQVPADGVVAGSGTIDGRPVMVGAEDFTTMGGSIGPGSTAKRYRIAELAELDRVPLVMLLEGAGHRPPMPGDPAPARTPTDLIQQARLSGRVPVVTGIMGASAGHGALIAPLSDLSLMTADAAVFTAGPPVVKASLGEDVTKEELGGPEVAVASGLVHNVAPDDAALLDDIRTYLAYFPSSAWSHPPRREGDDVGPRSVPEVLDLVPKDNRRAYDVREVVAALVDDGESFEVQAGFGRSIVCALAHLGGEPVAVVANQPMVLAGSIDVDAADKAAHFVQVADSFHIPLVFLSDNPGMLAGTASERAGILRAGARMFAAQAQARTVKLHVTLRKAFGFGSVAMSMVSFSGQSATYAFPGAILGAMGSAGAGEALGADEDKAAALRKAEMDAAYRSASGLGFDELIDPRDLRNALLSGLQRGLSRRQAAPEPTARTTISP